MRTPLRKQVNYNILVGGILIATSMLAGCASTNNISKNSSKIAYPTNERTCLERAMYFESNRTSREGMIAVGTVVMNRVQSSAYPNTICGVVGQKGQFAPGVLTKPMTETASSARVREAADAVLRGERSTKVKNAMFFHTAGLSYPYSNMHYVHVAGGNAFYEKRGRNGALTTPVLDSQYDVALAYKQDAKQNGTSFASLEKSTQPSQEAPMKASAPTTPTVVAEAKTIYTQTPKMINAIDPITTSSLDSSVALGYAQPSNEKLSEIGEFLLKNNKK